MSRSHRQQVAHPPDPHAWPDLAGVVGLVFGLLVLGVWFVTEVMF